MHNSSSKRTRKKPRRLTQALDLSIMTPQNSKPRFVIELSKGSPSPLAALALLSLVDPACCFHTQRGFRLPLGIYNISVSRACETLIAFCTRLEKYIAVSSNVDGPNTHAELQRELTDYIELAIYAAAEHVDDIKAIASGFFRSDKVFKKDAAAKRMSNSIKDAKVFVSAAANSIKHQQARIRTYSLEFRHSDIHSVLHGYFIEGVKDGVVGPNIIFHETQKIFSITTLAWEILLFLLQCSDALSKFLKTQASFTDGNASQASELLQKAVISAARLPLFTFDEEHPFVRATFVLAANEAVQRSLDSNLYGSFLHRWSLSEDVEFGKFKGGFVGDGVTKSFQLPRPSRVGLQHWT